MDLKRSSDKRYGVKTVCTPIPPVEVTQWDRCRGDRCRGMVGSAKSLDRRSRSRSRSAKSLVAPRSRSVCYEPTAPASPASENAGNPCWWVSGQPRGLTGDRCRTRSYPRSRLTRSYTVLAPLQLRSLVRCWLCGTIRRCMTGPSSGDADDTGLYRIK